MKRKALQVSFLTLFAFFLSVISNGVIGQQADNTLSKAEIKAGWILLFDGKATPLNTPGARALHENADYPADLPARLRSLGYVAPGKNVPTPATSAGRDAPESFPPSGRIRIRVDS